MSNFYFLDMPSHVAALRLQRDGLACIRRIGPLAESHRNRLTKGSVHPASSGIFLADGALPDTVLWHKLDMIVYSLLP